MLHLPGDANFSKSAPPGEDPPFTIWRDGVQIPPGKLPVQRAARGEGVEGEDLDLVLQAGEVLHTRVSARPLFDAGGAPRGAIACMLDLTDLTKSERALKEADRRKDEFLATLSHELRNPLAPILTGLEVMGMVDDPETLARTRATMERQVRQLVRLVDDLLDVSRITRGVLRLRRSPADLVQVVRDAVEASRRAMDQAGHRLSVQLPHEPVMMDIDPERLGQALSNLLDNAAEYTPRGGSIRLEVERDEADVVISVEDNGVGIPASMLGRVFEMFSQVDRSKEHGQSGLGIGLSLARSIAEMHGGTLEARSSGPGTGSTFVLRIPLPIEEQEIDDTPRSDRSQSGSPGAPRRVLVVDDNDAFVEALGIVVRTLGHEVQIARDGEGAIAMAEEFRPDLVLMDLGMPGMSGYEAAQRIRATPWGAGVRLVALTGWGQEEDKHRTREAGFDHHLVKPAKAAEIERLLAT
jgi:signal transduction histidine kinase